MVAFPPCKVNLGLNILRRRPDGYHDIETCFYPVPRTDVLEIVPSREFKFVQTGIDIPGPENENICVKAYELLKKDRQIGPVEIHLHKLIPPGAGLGAGSSDGAWTLRLLNDVFNLSLSHSTLSEYAGKLGSDCSFFMHEKPMIGTGRGDQLKEVEVSLKGKFIVIVRPDVHISTQEAYSAIVPEADVISVRSVVETLPPDRWKGKLVNQFEANACRKHPEIKKIREELYANGALYASMTGSGSAVFGLFDAEVKPLGGFRGMDYWSGWLTA
jgi:4-diphosphocytidyl-2-C-methyl-D-erythritol kinase